MVFHYWIIANSPIYYYTPEDTLPNQARVKLNRVFFPRWLIRASSVPDAVGSLEGR
jgi:hypothetical protein